MDCILSNTTFRVQISNNIVGEDFEENKNKKKMGKDKIFQVKEGVYYFDIIIYIV